MLLQVRTLCTLLIILLKRGVPLKSPVAVPAEVGTHQNTASVAGTSIYGVAVSAEDSAFYTAVTKPVDPPPVDPPPVATCPTSCKSLIDVIWLNSQQNYVVLNCSYDSNLGAGSVSIEYGLVGETRYPEVVEISDKICKDSLGHSYNISIAEQNECASYAKTTLSIFINGGCNITPP